MKKVNDRSLWFFTVVALSQSILLFLVNTYMPLFSKYYLLLTVWFVLWGVFILLIDNALYRWRLVGVAGLLSLACSMMVTWQFSMNIINFAMVVVAIYAIHSLLSVYHQRGSTTITYKTYYYAVWKDFFILLVALIFSLFVWAILGLWALFFKTANINFFLNLFFENRFFFWVAMPIIFSAALYVAHLSEKFIYQLLNIVTVFGKVLLCVLFIFATLYLVMWEVLGLMFSNHLFQLAIFETNYFLVTFLFLSIVFINAIYEDGSKIGQASPFYRWMLTIFLVMLLIMSILPINSLIHSLIYYPSRIGKGNIALHSATVILFVYVLAYFIIRFVKRTPWLALLGKTNIILAWVFIIICLLLNNPIMVSRAKSTVLYHGSRDVPRTLKQMRLTWVNHNKLKNQKGIILGYRLKTPIYICRILSNKKNYAGIAYQGECVGVINNRMNRSKNFQVLTGRLNVIWSNPSSLNAYNYNALTGSAQKMDKLRDLRYCRTIYNNVIHFGTVSSSARCVIVVKNQIMSSQYFQVLKK